MRAADVLAILSGAVTTLTLSAIGILLGLPLGLAMALIRWGRVPLASQLVAVYVSLLRATPLVTLLLLLFFALPNVGVPIGPISAGVVALTLNTSAFNCEVWRGAFFGFFQDHKEGGRTVGEGAGPRLFRPLFFPNPYGRPPPLL